MVHRQCSELLSEKTVEREPSTIYLFTFIIKLKAFNAIRVRETLLLYHNRLHPLNPIRAANSLLIFLQNRSKQFIICSFVVGDSDIYGRMQQLLQQNLFPFINR